VSMLTRTFYVNTTRPDESSALPLERQPVWRLVEQTIDHGRVSNRFVVVGKTLAEAQALLAVHAEYNTVYAGASGPYRNESSAQALLAVHPEHNTVYAEEN